MLDGGSGSYVGPRARSVRAAGPYVYRNFISFVIVTSITINSSQSVAQRAKLTGAAHELTLQVAALF